MSAHRRSVDELLAELRGDVCRCGKTKRPAQTFCAACYFRLAPPTRRALYAGVGFGYEDAYAAAVDVLERHDAEGNAR